MADRERSTEQRMVGRPSPISYADDNETWAIHLDTYGPSERRRASALVKRLASENGFHDAWLHETGDELRVYRGRFLDPSLPSAMRELRETRMTIVDGQKIYEAAPMVLAIKATRSTPAGQGASVEPAEWDLAGYRNKGELYSLLVAEFNSAGGKNFSESAEVYARELRDGGVEAYYYHTATGSSSVVTVGLFSEDQAFDQDPNGAAGYSDLIYRVKQARFEHMLINGMTVRSKKTREFMPAQLIKVPQ